MPSGLSLGEAYSSAGAAHIRLHETFKQRVNEQNDVNLTFAKPLFQLSCKRSSNV